MGHTKISGVGPAVLAKARSIHSIFDYHATARGGWCLLRLAPQRRGRVMAPSSIACIGKPSPHHGFEHSAPGATMPIEQCPQPLRDCCPNSLETSRISLASVQKLCRCWSRRQKLVETNWHSPRSLSTLLFAQFTSEANSCFSSEGRRATQGALGPARATELMEGGPETAGTPTTLATTS